MEYFSPQKTQYTNMLHRVRDMENVVKLSGGRRTKPEENRSKVCLIFMEILQVALKHWPEMMIHS